MICGNCNMDAVTWQGPLTALTHAECSNCGAVGSQVGVNEGDTCNRDGCTGQIELLPDNGESGGCACHISPPCGFCTSTMPECPECGWREAGA